MKMIAYSTILLFPLIVYGLEPFVNPEINSPKCCPLNSHLLNTSGTLSCSERRQYIQVHAKPLELFEKCSDHCVDFLSSNHNRLVRYDCRTKGIEYQTHREYPKCCPLNYHYDPVLHGCAKGRVIEEPVGFTVLNISLSHCPLKTHAIVDYITANTTTFDSELKVSFDNNTFDYGTYCLDETKNKSRVVRVCQTYESTCKRSFDDNKVRCIRKCCLDGQIYIGNTCEIAFEYGVDINHTKIKQSKENFAVIQSHVANKYIAKPHHNCEVDKIGDLSCISKNSPVTSNSKDAPYCTEMHLSKNVSIQRFFLFLPKTLPLTESKLKINSVGLAISCFFFLLTMVLYCLLPDALHLFGKSILCYCFITFLGYLTLSAMQFNNKSVWDKSFCLTIGFIIMFTFLGSFTWLNIICFDMYMAFGTMKLIKVGNKRRDRKRFIFYNLYGWGVPTVLTLITYVIYKTDCVPDPIKPVIGRGTCFFQHTRKNGYDHLLYFVLPLTILIVCNAVLFLKTIIYYFKVKTEINTMNDNYATDKEKRFKLFNADREKMIMLMKLFLVMGISWMFEVVSDVISFKSNSVLQVIEIIWDSFNSLQGLFIFCIFMVKAKTWEALKKKFCPAFGRRRSEHSSATLGTTLYSSSEDPRSIRLMSREKSIEKD
ncbi:PREDICTED: G-protein coupled receptor Mth-like isoform X1 [Nicrophorus vespilloides]|uniref:G-protein coupled receptor Mth-like isoform X1 n=1 Tax=Nicrophorus vespilloides TaxID=110193 RepID=A0ABM1N0C5_NICVS|nr:PREDICTED: G-protein coupled receptor Mth-like isoform X1 [Nicrophorus vespilloides]